jgi:hypothetical protein
MSLLGCADTIPVDLDKDSNNNLDGAEQVEMSYNELHVIISRSWLSVEIRCDSRVHKHYAYKPNTAYSL